MIYYCSLDGKDSSSGKSETTAWRYLSTGAQRLLPGDTLRLVSGEYSNYRDTIDSQEYALPVGDNWERAMTVEAIPGHHVTIRPSNRHAVRLTNGPHAYWIFRDMFMDGSLQTDQGESSPELVYTSSGTHHIRLERIKIAHCMGIGLQFTIANVPAPGPYSTFHELIDCEFWDVGNSLIGDEGINNGYLTYTQTDDNLWLRCYFHDTAGSGTVCYGSRNRFVSSWWERCGTRGGAAYAHIFGSSSHVDTDGQAIHSVDNEFINNAVVDNPYGGVMVYTNTERTKVYHNTILRNNQFGIMTQYMAGPALIKNNIILDHEQPIAALDPNVDQGSNFTEGDPQFVLSTDWDYRLKSTSPCRNAGVDVGVTTDYFGNPRDAMPDIGGAEYDSVDGSVDPPPIDMNKTFHVTGDAIVRLDGTVEFTGVLNTSRRRRGVVSRNPVTVPTND